MIGIQLDGDDEFLQLDPDSAIEITLENPLLNEPNKLSAGDYSLPFELPGEDISESNAAKLKNPDVIANNEAYQIQKASLFFDNVPFKKGNLKAKTATNQKISSYFTFGLGSISPDLKEAKLRDVLNEEIVIDDTPITKKIYIRKRDGSDFDFSVNGKSYTLSNYPAVNSDGTAAVDSGKYMPYATIILSGTTPSGLIEAPYLKLDLRVYYLYHDPVLDMDFGLYTICTDPLAELSVSVSDPQDFLIETDLGSYFDGFDTFFSDYFNGDYPTDKFRMPLRFNMNPYDEILKDGSIVNGVNASGIIRNNPSPDIDLLASIPQWSSSGNYNSDGSGDGKYCKHPDSDGNNEYWITGYTSNINLAPTTTQNYWHKIKYYFKSKNYNTLQPFLRMKWVLDKIGEQFGFTLEGDFYDHADIENMLIDNPASLDLPQSFINDKKFVFWRRSFNINELVPDITVIELFKRLQSRYNIAVYHNERTNKVRLQFREPIAKSNAYEDITAISSPIKQNDDLRYTGFTLIVPKDSTDGLSVVESLTVGIGEQKIEIKCGRLHGSYSDIIDGKLVQGPSVSQKIGADPTTQKFAENYDLRIFYDAGIINTGTFNYSSAKISGTTIYEGLSNFIILEGIYERFWRYWLLFDTKRKVVTIEVCFPFRSIRHLDWELKRRYDRSNYMIKSIKIRMTSKDFKVTSVQLYTMV